MPTNILFLLNVRSSAPPGLLASETLCGYQGSLAGLMLAQDPVGSSKDGVPLLRLGQMTRSG